MSNLHAPRNFTTILGLGKLLLIVLLISGIMACATGAPEYPGYLAIDYDSQIPGISRVALITDLTPPEIESVDLGFTRGEGAAGGAATGALEGLRGALDGMKGCSGEFCGAALLLVLPIFMLAGAVVGTVSGVDSGYSADLLAEAEANAQNMLNSAVLQVELLDRTQSYGSENVNLAFIRLPGTDPETLSDKPDYKDLSAESIDAVLEVELLRLSMKYSLKIEARARLISTKTGVVLSDGQYTFLSEHHRLEAWLANDASPLTEAIQRGLQTLAEDIVDENFLLFYPNEPKQIITQQVDETSDEAEESSDIQYMEDTPVPHYVLSPIYPKLDHCFFCKLRVIGNLEFVEVDSVQPTLQWESFPREHDLLDADGRTHKISDVRYELRIFDVGLPAKSSIVVIPAQLIYEARDIAEPYHKIENVLDACKNYFWTVRARFKLDGRLRVIEWAGAFNVGGWNEKPWNLRRGLTQYKFSGISLDGPEWFYFPFRTPCQSEKKPKSKKAHESENTTQTYDDY
jgi:hypothetical protein